MDTTDALKEGRLDAALASAKDAVRKAPTDAAHRSVLFQLYCLTGNWDGALTQLRLVSDFDVSAALWVGVCERLLACERERQRVFAGEKPPTLFGQPQEWVGNTVEALRLGLDGHWDAAAASQARALEAAPAVAAEVNGQRVEWLADGDSRFGPVLEAFMDGKYYWVPFEHLKELRLRPRTHLMDSIWAPVDFVWTNEGRADGYVPVRYPDSEKSADSQVQLGRKTGWREAAENYFLGEGHRSFVSNAAEYGLAELQSVRFLSAPAA